MVHCLCSLLKKIPVNQTMENVEPIHLKKCLFFRPLPLSWWMIIGAAISGTFLQGQFMYWILH
jgi:hypothetical protein